MIKRFIIPASLLVCLLGIFSIAFSSHSNNVGSDPKLTLLVSQTILKYGTVQLDRYAGEMIIDVPFEEMTQGGNIIESQGHFYDYFPTAPALLSLPAVAIGQFFKLDMLTSDNFLLQKILAAITSCLVFLLIFKLARCYLSGFQSLATAVISVLGTTLISTLGTALWSLNFTTLFLGTALYLLVRSTEDRARKVNPALFGLLLFLAFICRPSSAAFILPGLIYLIWLDRRAGIWASVVSAACLALFLGWSQLTFGSPLPIYFSTARLVAERSPLWIGVAGNLVSPGRGLFVFSPFFLLVPLGFVFSWRWGGKRPLILLCLTWFGLHLLLVSRAASWWGGASFGPRLLTDAQLALILLLILAWRHVLDHYQPRTARLFQTAFLLLGLASVFIHSYRGLYVHAAADWSIVVDPRPIALDEGLGDMFNWRYLQWATSEPALCAIQRDNINQYLALVEPYTAVSLDDTITHCSDEILNLRQMAREASWYPVEDTEVSSPPPDSYIFQSYLPVIHAQGNPAVFIGWANPEPTQRWSRCAESTILFKLVDEPLPERLNLTITAQAFGEQRSEIWLNGDLVGTLEWGGETAVQSLPIPASLLRLGEKNNLTFRLPDAAASVQGRKNQRHLGIAFSSLSLSDSGD